MKYYPIKATTFRDLNKFEFGSYTAISINMLKYNHDSSATFRFLSSFTESSAPLIDDLNHGSNLGMQKLSFLCLDRINGFTGDLEDFRGGSSWFYVGYSRYTDQEYTMKAVDSYSEFVRHSIPCDGFFSGSYLVEDPFTVYVYPNVKYPIKRFINNTAISLKPLDGFNLLNKTTFDPIRIKLFGRDIAGQKFEEITYITTYVDHITERDYSYIDYIMVLDAKLSVGIEISPFITGEAAFQLRPIVDRENHDPSICVVTVDMEKKTLNYNALRDRTTEYPQIWEPLKTVPIDLPEEESITRYFCDTDNKLLYLTTNHGELGRLYVFPLVIPRTDDATLDFKKTEKQSITIEYLEDCADEAFNIWIHPTSKTNDIEILSISINDVVFKSNIILDLISYNVETNKIQIPFSEFVIDGEYNDTIVVTFDTIGLEENSSVSILLDRTKIKKIFSIQLDLSISAKPFKSYPVSDQEWESAELKSTNKDYKPYGSYGFGEEGFGGIIGGSSSLIGFGGAKQIRQEGRFFKVSSSPNVFLDGQKISFVYDTFFWNERTHKLITHDTITHMYASADPAAIIDPDEETEVSKVPYFFSGTSSAIDIGSLTLGDLDRTIIVGKPIGEITFTLPVNEYLWFLYPKRFGTVTIEYNNQEVTGFVISETTYNGEIYISYRSEYKYNSSTTIELI